MGEPATLYSRTHPLLAEKVIYVFQSAEAVPYFAKRHLQLSERRPCKRGLIYSSPCTDLHCNPRKAVDSQPGFLNKNQNPTLHFRLLKAASAGEVFLCALAPPLPIPRDNTERVRPAAPPPQKRPTARDQGGSPSPGLATVPPPSTQLARPDPSGTAPLPASYESPVPPVRRKARGGGAGGALPTHKTGGLAVVLPEVPQGHLQLRPHLPMSP